MIEIFLNNNPIDFDPNQIELDYPLILDNVLSRGALRSTAIELPTTKDNLRLFWRNYIPGALHKLQRLDVVFSFFDQKFSATLVIHDVQDEVIRAQLLFCPIFDKLSQLKVTKIVDQFGSVELAKNPTNWGEDIYKFIPLWHGYDKMLSFGNWQWGEMTAAYNVLGILQSALGEFDYRLAFPSIVLTENPYLVFFDNHKIRQVEWVKRNYAEASVNFSWEYSDPQQPQFTFDLPVNLTASEQRFSHKINQDGRYLLESGTLRAKVDVQIGWQIVGQIQNPVSVTLRLITPKGNHDYQFTINTLAGSQKVTIDTQSEFYLNAGELHLKVFGGGRINPVFGEQSFILTITGDVVFQPDTRRGAGYQLQLSELISEDLTVAQLLQQLCALYNLWPVVDLDRKEITLTTFDNFWSGWLDLTQKVIPESAKIFTDKTRQRWKIGYQRDKEDVNDLGNFVTLDFEETGEINELLNLFSYPYIDFGYGLGGAPEEREILAVRGDENYNFNPKWLTVNVVNRNWIFNGQQKQTFPRVYPIINPEQIRNRWRGLLMSISEGVIVEVDVAITLQELWVKLFSPLRGAKVVIYDGKLNGEYYILSVRYQFGSQIAKFKLLKTI